MENYRPRLLLAALVNKTALKGKKCPVFLGNREPTGSSYDVKRNNACGWAMPCLGAVIDRLPPIYEMYDRMRATPFGIFVT